MIINFCHLYMSTQSIITYIKNEYYINNNEISKINYFKGDINEYKENILEIFKEEFKNNYIEDTTTSIFINNNKYWFYISYTIDNYDLFWYIKIIKDNNKN